MSDQESRRDASCAALEEHLSLTEIHPEGKYYAHYRISEKNKGVWMDREDDDAH